MNVSFYPFYSLLLKLSNKGMGFPFPLLKLPNKEMEEYFKIIIFISFHSIPCPNRNLIFTMLVWIKTDKLTWLVFTGPFLGPASIIFSFAQNYGPYLIFQCVFISDRNMGQSQDQAYHLSYHSPGVVGPRDIILLKL